MTDTLFLEGASPARPRFENSTDTQRDRDSNRLSGDLASVCGVWNATAARMVGVITEVLATEAWNWPGIRSAAHWVGWKCGVTPRHAQDLVQMARRLPDMPVTRGLFDTGQLSEDHVKIICRRVPASYEADVAELALMLTSTQLSYLVNEYPWHDDKEESGDDDNPDLPPKRRVSFGSVSDKLWRLHAQLHPDEGAMLEKALTAARDALFRECDEQAAGDAELAKKLKGEVTWADAMVRLGDSYLGGRDQARAVRDRYRVLIHLNAQRRLDPQPGCADTSDTDRRADSDQPDRPDPQTATADRDAAEPPPDPARRPDNPNDPNDPPAFTLPGLAEPVEPHAHFHLGTALPDSLRRLITCDADLAPVFAYQGVVHHVGTSQRTVPERLRWTVEQRDKGCRVPGCGRTLWLQIHHIVHWEDGGPTQTWNLCALCSTHHRGHHQGRLAITGNADRPDGLIFTDARGSRIRSPRPPPPVTHHPYDAAQDLDIPVRPYDCAWHEPVQWKWVDLYPRSPPGPSGPAGPSMN